MEDYFKSISADAEVLTDKWPCSMCIFNDNNDSDSSRQF